jgi:hypothetical protein
MGYGIGLAVIARYDYFSMHLVVNGDVLDVSHHGEYMRAFIYVFSSHTSFVQQQKDKLNRWMDGL